MILLLVGVLVVSFPLALAARTVARLVRVLGAVDASAIGQAIHRDPALDLDALAQALARTARGSVAERLLRNAVARDHGSLLSRRLSLGEEVADIERELGQDVRVPRVAASLATTGGLLAAALVMREGLGVVVPEGVDPVPMFYGVIEKGLTLAAVAVLGGIACASLHRAAQRERRARLDELDALVLPLSARVFGPEEPT